MNKNILVIIIIIISFFSCSKKDNLNVDVSKVDVNVTIKRFEQAFYNAKPADLTKIKNDFWYLFPHNIDSIWIKKMQDKDEQELFAATQKVYPDLELEKTQLTDLFKHVKYYYPKFKAPKVITINSNVRFEQSVVYADSLLFVSLDVFLGKDNEIYQDYPTYIRQNFTKEHLIVSVAEEIARPTIPKSNDRTFLGKMVQQGKLLYALDAFLPTTEDFNKIGYSNEQLEWAKANEDMIWKYFVEKELLYDTDLELDKRFIEPAPFSKFYLDIDTESPGRVGAWLGWRIVRSFMDNNEVVFTDMMALDNEKLFKQSKYKPQK